MQGVKQSSAAVAEHVATTIFAIVGSRADTSPGISAAVPQLPTTGPMASTPRVAITGNPRCSDVGAPRGGLDGASRGAPISSLLALAKVSHLRKRAVGTTCRATCTGTCKTLVWCGGVRRCDAGCMHVGTRKCITLRTLSVWPEDEQSWCLQGGIGWMPEARRPRRAHCRPFGVHPASLLGRLGDVRLRWPGLWSVSLQARSSGVCPIVGRLVGKLGGQVACHRRSLGWSRAQSHSGSQRANLPNRFDAGPTACPSVSFSSWLQAGVMSASPSRQAACSEVDVEGGQMTALQVGREAAKMPGELGGYASIELRSQPVGSTHCKLLFEMAGEVVGISCSSKEGFPARRRIVRRGGLSTDLRAGRQSNLSGGLADFLSVDLSGGLTLNLSTSPDEGLRDGRLGDLSVGSQGGHRTSCMKRLTSCQRRCNTTGWVWCKSAGAVAGPSVRSLCASKESFRAGLRAVRRSSLAADPRVRPTAGLAGGRRRVLLRCPARRQ